MQLLYEWKVVVVMTERNDKTDKLYEFLQKQAVWISEEPDPVIKRPGIICHKRWLNTGYSVSTYKSERTNKLYFLVFNGLEWLACVFNFDDAVNYCYGLEVTFFTRGTAKQ
jgi:hypothetical protein